MFFMEGSKTWGVLAFVFGLVSVITYFTISFPILSLVFSLIGIVFSILQFRKGKEVFSILGLILSILVLSIFLFNLIASIFISTVMIPNMRQNLASADFCLNKESISERDTCYYNEVFGGRDKSFCSKIIDSSIRERCNSLN
jgi:predicted membrane protein